MFRLEWQEFPGYATTAVDVRARIRSVVAGRMRRAMQKVADDAAARTPYAKIASSYKIEQDTAGTQIAFSIYNTSPLWPLREFDTKPHMIFARNAPWLVFQPQGTSHLVQVKSVHHPGTKGDHTFQDAWDRNADALSAAIDGAYKAVLERLGDYSGD